MTPASVDERAIDLVVIGGGPAGMSAALVAGRARLETVVVNEESPRNAVTTASHGFLTRDGAHPSDLLEVAKEQLAPYGSVRYLKGRADRISRTGETFRVELAAGAALLAERVILASGQRDDLAATGLPGLEDVYGRSVFPCPFCDGYEHRDQRLAVFGGPGVEHYVRVVRVWSSDIVVFTNGSALGREAVEDLERAGVGMELDPIERLHSTDGLLGAVSLRGGARIAREAGFIADVPSAPGHSFSEDLGVERTENDWGLDVPEVDAVGRASVPGIYAVGDARSGFGGIAAAVADGAACAEGIVHELAAARWALRAGRP